MKKHLMIRDYDGEEINDIHDDVMESLNTLGEGEVDDYGIIKGKVRIISHFGISLVKSNFTHKD